MNVPRETLAGVPLAPPLCMHCPSKGRLTDSRAVHPHNPLLWGDPIWICPNCGAYVGCHPGSNSPLGRPANHYLRRARRLVHARMDPLWRGLPTPSAIAVRNRLYEFLCDRMGMTRSDCHVGHFGQAECEAALRHLQGISIEKLFPENRLGSPQAAIQEPGGPSPA